MSISPVSATHLRPTKFHRRNRWALSPVRLRVFTNIYPHILETDRPWEQSLEKFMANQNTKNRLSRRDFIKIGSTAAAVGAAALAAQKAKSSPKIDPISAQEGQSEAVIKTTCALCSSGCGLDVRVVDGRAVKVEGNPLHPVNQGICCLRGQASLEVLYSPERLERPRRQTGERGSGEWEEISWDQALEMVAEKLADMRKSGQAHQLALVHGELRGQMRGLVSRFMQSYGSPNLISRASLGEQAVRQAMFLSQGINGLPVYDLNNANYAITFGGNLLETSRNVIAALGSVAFMRRGRPQRGKLVAVHPRLALTGMKADEWIPIRPGTYAALALGIANIIINSQLYDQEFIDNFTFGFDDFEDQEGNPHQGFKGLVLEQYDLERVAMITGVPAEVIARLAGEFATNRPAVAIMPTEAGELSSGNALYTAMAIHALNALVGSIDTQGGVLVQRFPELSAWPGFDADNHSKKGLAQPRIDQAGSDIFPLALSAYQKLAGNILAEKPYPLEALFTLNANTVYDLPNSFAEALLKVPFVVSFASTMDESAAHADLILPSSTFLEVWGDDYLEGLGFAGVSLRQPVVETVHDTRNPGEIFLDLAARLGGPPSKALPFDDFKTVIEYRMEALDLDWEKFEANGNWSEMVYFNAEPGSTAWSQVVGCDRLNAPQDGRFDFFSRELFSLLASPEDQDCLPHFELPAPMTESGADPNQFPLLLVSQQLITRTENWQGVIPSLQECVGLQSFMKWDSWVEINPHTAEELDIHNGDRVWVESPQGKLQAIVRLYEGLWPNAVYLPPGMGHRTLVKWGRAASDNWEVGVNPNRLVEFGDEAISGQAIFSPTRVRIYKS
jgi:anaerobic selenocysteine-containing dehydrogenase